MMGKNKSILNDLVYAIDDYCRVYHEEQYDLLINFILTMHIKVLMLPTGQGVIIK